VRDGGGYASTAAAYGRAADAYLARTRCAAAGHAVLRSPLPLPLAFPRLLPPGEYDYAGAYVGPGAGARGARAARLPPGVPPDAAAAAALGLASAGGAGPGAGVGYPFSVPAAAALANGGAGAGACLARLARDFAARDRALAHRFGAAAGERTGSRAGIELDEVAAALAGLADEYGPRGEEGGE